jgi:hypothetical protein
MSTLLPPEWQPSGGAFVLHNLILLLLPMVEKALVSFCLFLFN